MKRSFYQTVDSKREPKEMKILNRLQKIKSDAIWLTDDEESFADVIQLDVDDYTYLIEQADKMEKVEYEINNSDMGAGIENIIEIVNS